MAKMSVEQALLRAKSHAKKGEADNARSLLEAMQKAFPRNKRIRAELSKLTKPQQSPNNTINPPKQQADALLGLFNQQRFDEAAKFAEQLALHYPTSFVLWNVLGAAQAELGNFQKAEYGFRKATEIQPKYPEAHSNLGNICKEQGKFNDAISAYKNALALKPDFLDALYNMSICLRDQGKFEDAMSACEKVIELNSDYADAYNSMASILQEIGRIDEAITAYRRALAIRPDFFEAAKNLSQIPVGRLDKDSLDACANVLLAASQEGEMTSRALFLKARLKHHENLFSDAFDLFVRANRAKITEDHITKEDFDSVAEELRKNDSKMKELLQDPTRTKGQYLKKVFILGPSRSGKSTLERLLSKSKSVKPLYENINPTPFATENARARTPDDKAFHHYFYHDEKHLLNAGYTTVTSTNPETLFRLSDIIENMQDYYFVFVSRDPLDIGSEIYTTEYDEENTYSYDPKEIMTYLDLYNEFSIAMHKLSPDRVIRVGFEDIVNHPASVVAGVETLISAQLDVDHTAQRTENIPTKAPFRDLFAHLLT